MKYIIYILFYFIPVLGISQFAIKEPNDLSYFIAPTPPSQTNDSLHRQIFIDSLVKVSSGITIEIPLHKEIVKWPNGGTRMIRYYNGLEPYGTWMYFTRQNEQLYTLFISDNYVLLKSHKEQNNITRIRKYASLENLEYARCSEQLLNLDGHILASGERIPISISNHLKLVESGKWKYFFPNGNLESVGRFWNGKKDGKWVYYNQNGRKIRVVTFSYGEMVSQKEYVNK